MNLHPLCYSVRSIIIVNNDFDVFWYSSLQVHPTENKNCFTVSYRFTKIKVTLQRQDCKYKIADVELFH